MGKEIAIIMAAGLGTRMKPITNTTAKPLVKVKDRPMIETIIDGLEKRGINKIYIVIGYKKEQFYYLTQKYNNISLVVNTEYNKKNNISSLKAVGNILGSADCFICEGDLYIGDDSIFEGEFNKSCYFGKVVEKDIVDWGFNMDGDRITQIRLDEGNIYNMAGISYWKQSDAKVIYNSIEKVYNDKGHESLYWDEIVDKEIKNVYVTINLVDNSQIVEIDSCKELIALKEYLKY